MHEADVCCAVYTVVNTIVPGSGAFAVLGISAI